jgi:hypothetical protein
MGDEADTPIGPVARLRGLSVSLMDMNPAPGMWAATGTAIAHAPNWAQLRAADEDVSAIEFTSQGYSAVGVPLEKAQTVEPSQPVEIGKQELSGGALQRIPTRVESTSQIDSLGNIINASDRKKHGFWATINQGRKAFWKFFITPTVRFLYQYSNWQAQTKLTF